MNSDYCYDSHSFYKLLRENGGVFIKLRYVCEDLQVTWCEHFLNNFYDVLVKVS